MIIKLSPVRMNEMIEAKVSGDKLIINGEIFDFSMLPEGGRLPGDAINSNWIACDVSRIAGEINITIIFPHGHNAPQETRFPAAYDVPMTVLDGLVPLPPYDALPVEMDQEMVS